MMMTLIIFIFVYFPWYDQNENGIKFGLVVNDMAQVNVDSKLIKSQVQGFEGELYMLYIYKNLIE